MFDNALKPRVVDFSFSSLSTTKNWDGYVDPDLPAKSDTSHRQKADVYAYGMILFQIIVGPWRDHPPARTPAIPDDAPDLVAGIYECCIKKPDERPEFFDIVQALADSSTPPFPGTNPDIFGPYKNEILERTLKSIEAEDVFKLPLPEVKAGTSQRPKPQGDLRTLADNGDIDSMLTYAHHLRIGRGCVQDMKLAYEYYRRAGNAGSSEGKYHQARFLKEGLINGTVNLPEAFRVMTEAANARVKSVKAIYDLAEMYLSGEGTAPNPRQAYALFKQGADMDDMDSQYRYARMSYEGANGVNRDIAAATQYYRLAHQSGYEPASCDYALMLLTGDLGLKNIPEGLKIIGQAATRGSVHAQWNLGSIYFGGRYGVPKDIPAAARLFKMAAEQNHPKATSYYGVCLKNGSAGVPVNLGLARAFFKKGADAGDDIGMNNYAGMCEKGEGGGKDLIEAYKYYKLAAQKGAGKAKEHFVRLTINGPANLTKDVPQARAWAQELVEKGVAGMAEQLAKLRSVK
jgi:TPR repeat protein